MNSLKIVITTACCLLVAAMPAICLAQTTTSPDVKGNGEGLENSSSKRVLDKTQALAIAMQEVRADPKYAANGAGWMRVSDCLVGVQVDWIFEKGASSIEEGTFRRRLKGVGLSAPSEATRDEMIACFALAVPRDKVAVSSANLLPITTDDFRLDYSSLRGKQVRVEGEVLFAMNLFMLKKSNMDMSPILMDVSKLSRDEQKKILQECATLLSVCKGFVHGTAGPVANQNGIIVDGIQWRNR